MRSGASRHGCRRAAELLLAVLPCLAVGALRLPATASASTVRVEYEDTLGDVKVTEATEVEIKAAFLLRFPDFVSWPADLGDTLRIGVSGDDALLDMLQLLAEQENSRRLGTHYSVLVTRVIDPAAVQRYHMLVLGETALPELFTPRIPTPHVGTLTVNVWNRPRDGTIIHLFREGDRVRFDISQALAREAKLRISSKLLNLAQQQSNRSK